MEEVEEVAEEQAGVKEMQEGVAEEELVGEAVAVGMQQGEAVEADEANRAALPPHLMHLRAAQSMARLSTCPMTRCFRSSPCSVVVPPHTKTSPRAAWRKHGGLQLL